MKYVVENHEEDKFKNGINKVWVKVLVHRPTAQI